MRVRNKENHIFEQYNSWTTKSTMIFTIFIFIALYILFWFLSYLVYLESNIIAARIAFLCSFFLLTWWFLTLILGWPQNYQKLKKWRKHDFLEKYFNDYQVSNNSNYYRNPNLEKRFQTQLIKSLLYCSFVLNAPTLIIFFLSIQVKAYSFSGSMVCIYMWISYLLYQEFKKELDAIKQWNTHILRRNIKSYYIYGNKIFFY